jgi:hypothetical protein
MSRFFRHTRFLVVGLMAHWLAAAACAEPSLSGPSGLITIPTALTLHQWEADLSFSQWQVDGPFGDYTANNLRVGVGVWDAKDSGLELGAVRPKLDVIGLTDAYLFAKYRIPGILPGGALSAGGIFSTDKRNYTSLFVMGSSAIAHSFALHYGVGFNIYGDPLGYSFFGARRENGRADPAFALFGGEFDYRRVKFNVDYNGSFVSYGVNFFPDSFFSVSVFKLGNGDYERLLGLRNGVGYSITLRL